MIPEIVTFNWKNIMFKNKTTQQTENKADEEGIPNFAIITVITPASVRSSHRSL